MSREPTPLERVYAATNQGELADAYASWSNDYDRETAALGYCLPFVIAGWVARHVPKDAGPLLDAGCGTGLAAPGLRALGYDRIEGVDLTREMLAIAAARGFYRKLERAELGRTLPWPDGHFAAVLSAGVFTEGHAPASSLDELARVTRRGGHAVFTVRDSVLERGGFRQTFERLEKEGSWLAVEESPSFRAFVLAEPELEVKAFVFRML
jgi:predicted TPR repeat methyltransferase